MISESFQTMAEVKHSLHVFICFSLLGAFLVPWAAAIWDNLKGKR